MTQSETGHTKIQTNFFTLKTFCASYSPNYLPTNPQITIPALTTHHAAAKTAIEAVSQHKVPFARAQGARYLIFKPLKPLTTRILSSLKSVNAPETTIKDAQQITRKIQGTKKRKTQTPDDTTKDPISTSQQSYDMKLDHFKKLVELLIAEILYAPNETDLKTASLLTLITTLDTANQAVITAYVPYSNALITRNTVLYAPETGIIDLSKDVKNYIKSLFGFNSPQFKQTNAIRFRYPRNHYR